MILSPRESDVYQGGLSGGLPLASLVRTFSLYLRDFSILRVSMLDILTCHHAVALPNRSSVGLSAPLQNGSFKPGSRLLHPRNVHHRSVRRNSLITKIPNPRRDPSLILSFVDKIEYIDAHRAAQDRIIGGAGTFAALGARLAAGSRHARAVSWIVDMGSDFPPEFQALIDAWATSCTFRLDRARLTTTAWNGYGENEYRGT